MGHAKLNSRWTTWQNNACKKKEKGNTVQDEIHAKETMRARISFNQTIVYIN